MLPTLTISNSTVARRSQCA